MSADDPNESSGCLQELDRPLPRPVRLRGIGITLCVFALAWIVFGVGNAAHLCIPELRRQAANDSLTRRLTAEGRETEATVARLSSGAGLNAVTYDYAIDGRSYEANALIASERWQSLQVGSPLAIRYLPSDPTQAYPEADPPNSRNDLPTFLLVLCFALGFPLFFAALCLSVLWRKRCLLAGGHAVHGVVTYCRAIQHSGGRYVLYYSFPLPEGGMCQGRGHSRAQLAEGSIVTVLYDPNKPRRNAPYPMETVRLAAI
jgi:hypothetical protein